MITFTSKQKNVCGKEYNKGNLKLHTIQKYDQQFGNGLT